jgi:peptidoglycan/LPS O-acetylase OafA/YrhL
MLLLLFKPYYPDLNLFRSGVSPFIILFSLGMFAADLAFSGNSMAVRVRSFFGRLNTRTVILFFIITGIVYKLIPEQRDLSNPSDNTYNLIVIESKDILFGVISAAFLLLCTISNTLTIKKYLILNFLDWKPLVFIGTFSYSLYLIHPPLLQLLTQYGLGGSHLPILWKTCLLIVIGTPLVVFMSYVFFLVFERPFLISAKKINIEKTEIIASQNPAI